MKLNNKGWSLREMLVLIAFIVVALLVAIFFIMQMMRDFGASFKESSPKQNDYILIEKKLEEATKTYMDKYYNNDTNGTNSVIVKSNILLTNNLITEKDLTISEIDSCTGYVIVNNGYKANIKCKKYTSSDYQEWRMSE